MTTSTFALRLALVLVAVLFTVAAAVTLVNYGRGECASGPGRGVYGQPERSILRLGACSA